jgi:hypothetical protein
MVLQKKKKKHRIIMQSYFLTQLNSEDAKA